MYIYKREKNNLSQARNMEYFLSNTQGLSLCMSGVLEAKRPYSGMYIKNGKIILENVYEEIEIKDKLYKMAQLNTSMKNISCDDYISGIDLFKNEFSYTIDMLKYKKTIAFCKYDDVLCIEYDIQNDYDISVLFRVLPLITYRELFSMRNATTLRFNQRSIENGVILNLSISDEENVFLKSNLLEYTKDTKIIGNVKHEMTDANLKKETFAEDLFVPGDFEITLEPFESKKVYLYVSCKDFEIADIDFDEVIKENEYTSNKILDKIPEEFVELKDLASSIEKLDLGDYLIKTLPYKTIFDFDLKINYETDQLKFLQDIETLIEILCAIDGQYIIFDRYKEAGIVLAKVRRAIREIDELNVEDEDCYIKIVNLKLWYIEILNKLYQKQPAIVDIYLNFVKEMLDSVLKEEKQKIVFSNILTCALSYNAIKVYENMISKLGFEDTKLAEIAICIKNLIEEKYWLEDKRVLKRNISDETANANIEMLFTLSLSYPCVFGNIPIKLLDTIFKELYTPYGLRMYPKRSLLNNGLIYPKYMAHFVKANLRQNGVTRASQKIAFNLVKELIQDISKFVNGGVKKVYHESGADITEESYDLLTNAEIIRLYDMLT